MSRFYQLIVTPVSSSGEAAKSPTTWTNKNGNKAILNAQRIEFDLTVTTGAIPQEGSFIRIWGPSKDQIKQASDFNGANIELYGGMQNGLPLATRAVQQNQQGLLVKGMVLQAFGNWQGITQTLDFVVIGGYQEMALQTDDARKAADVGAPTPPQNFSFTWKQGTSLTDNASDVLQQAFPGANIDVNAADDIILLHDESGVFTDFRTFSNYIIGISRDIKGPDYNGLNIVGNGKGFTVFDNTKEPDGTTEVTMFDLIGNVTWLDTNSIQFTTVLRADLAVSDYISLPPLAKAQAITTASSNSNVRDTNTFDGKWMVIYVRHVGDSRAPDAQAWVSTFMATGAASSATQ